MPTLSIDLRSSLNIAALCLLASACGEDVLEHHLAGADGSYPSEPPARICGDTALLSGAASAPAGAVSVPAGDNSMIALGKANKTYWFEPGVHTLGGDETSQIAAGTGSSYVGAPGAIIDGQGVNQFAFTHSAANVRIAHLEIRNFAAPNDNGVVNHDGGSGWVVEYNTIHQNRGSGLLVSSDNVVRFNCLRDNGQYGFQAILPGASGTNLTIDHNEVAQNGTGDPEHGGGGGSLWDIEHAVISANWIHDNAGAGIRANTNNRDVVVEGNSFESNYAEAFLYGSSYNAQLRRNAFRRNALGKGGEFADRADEFPVAAVYISESGGDSRVSGTPTLELSGNYFEDNWGGVTLWESADQFCGANEGSYCTLVGTRATLSSCKPPAIASAPLYDDCRWKTQNVAVHENEFRLTPGNIACASSLCARQALLSNQGSAPSWSPYLGGSTEDAVTFRQNNRFFANRYAGPWRFVAHDTSVELDFAAWRAAPYTQDEGSSLTGR